MDDSLRAAPRRAAAVQLGQDYSSRLEEVAIEQEAERQYDEDLCTAVGQQTLEQVNEF
jgi:hypothetical protein